MTQWEGGMERETDRERNRQAGKDRKIKIRNV